MEDEGSKGGGRRERQAVRWFWTSVSCERMNGRDGGESGVGGRRVSL